MSENVWLSIFIKNIFKLSHLNSKCCCYFLFYYSWQLAVSLSEMHRTETSRNMSQCCATSLHIIYPVQSLITVPSLSTPRSLSVNCLPSPGNNTISGHTYNTISWSPAGSGSARDDKYWERRRSVSKLDLFGPEGIVLNKQKRHLRKK